MNNKKKFLALFSGLVVVILIVAGLLSYKEASAPAEEDEVENKTEEIEDKVSIVSVKDSSDSFVIDTEYPKIGNGKIDKSLSSYIEDEIKIFKNNTSDGVNIPGRQNLLTIKVLDVYQDTKVVSVKFSVYTDTGGAHGLGIISGKNFFKDSGREMSAEDALSMTNETLWSLSEKATFHFKETIGDSLFVDGLSPQTENFKSFTINDTEITFHFSPYQIAAYALGAQEFSLPRKID